MPNDILQNSMNADIHKLKNALQTNTSEWQGISNVFMMELLFATYATIRLLFISLILNERMLNATYEIPNNSSMHKILLTCHLEPCARSAN